MRMWYVEFLQKIEKEDGVGDLKEVLLRLALFRVVRKGETLPNVTNAKTHGAEIS